MSDEPTPYERLVEAGRLPLMTASELAEEEEPAELGFEPDNHYLGFAIAGEELWPTVTRHQLWKQRFYVITDKGILGLVPWPGSRIVWPWEAGWHLDSHKEIVTSYLKEPKKETRKRG